MPGPLPSATHPDVRVFRQISVSEENIPKTALTTLFELFEFTCMGFSLRNAIQTFLRFIDEVLQDLDFCYIYIEYTLVTYIIWKYFSSTCETTM